MVFLRATARTVLLIISILGTVAAPAAAQASARVRVSENVRKDPNGEVLAQLEPGTTLDVVGHQDRWTQVDLEGWVWERSLQVTDREGMDLIVSAEDGENLRDAPSGNVLGRLVRGMLLEEVSRQTGWIQVRRRAWIWSPSLVETKPEPAPATRTAPSTPTRTTTSAPRKPVGYVPAGSRGAVILSAPGGDTIGTTAPRTEMEVVSREGNWARVRLEGWTWLPEGDTAAAADSTAPAALTPAELRRDPTAYRGRMVSWELQYISLEHAEKVRTDFFEGEPFLLARYGGSDGPFVYIAVPQDQVQSLKGLIPLERVAITGRVRTGASSLTGTPIVDLVSLERIRSPQ